MAKFGVENQYGGVDLQKTVEILWNKVMVADVPEPVIEEQEAPSTETLNTEANNEHTEG